MFGGFHGLGQRFLRWRRAGFLLLVGVAVPACVTSPQSNTSADDGASGMQFTGLADYQAGLTVTIQVREASGSFTNLASVPVTTDGRWSLSVPVPDHYFPGICGSATFRARTNHGLVLPALDSTCISGLPARATAAQVAACRVDNIVVARQRGNVQRRPHTRRSGRRRPVPMRQCRERQPLDCRGARRGCEWHLPTRRDVLAPEACASNGQLVD